MSDSPLLLVLSNVNDPQLGMLSGLPHVIAWNTEQAARAAHEAQVILHWSGPRDLVRAALLANPQIRWIHSKWAGLDSLLFPELVESPVPLTNGSGVFSQSLGEFVILGVLYFAKNVPRRIEAKAARKWD